MAVAQPIISPIAAADAEYNAGANRSYVDKRSKFYICGKSFWHHYGTASASNPGHFVFEGHVLEGLCLVASRADSSCMKVLGTPETSIGKKQLKQSKQLAILAFVTEGQVFDRCSTGLAGPSTIWWRVS